jgi:hypothetical protein
MLPCGQHDSVSPWHRSQSLYTAVFLLYNFLETTERTHTSLAGRANRSRAVDIGSSAEASDDRQARNLLEMKQRRLQTLSLQAARKGDDCPPEITIEIEVLRKEIASFQKL